MSYPPGRTQLSLSLSLSHFLQHILLAGAGLWPGIVRCSAEFDQIWARNDHVLGAFLEQRAAKVGRARALHRKASADVEPCLLALCGMLALSIPFLVVDIAVVGTRSVHLLPGFLVSSGIVYALLAAAAVSEKCGRVPALINAMSFGAGTERKRQLGCVREGAPGDLSVNLVLAWVSKRRPRMRAHRKGAHSGSHLREVKHDVLDAYCL